MYKLRECKVGCRSVTTDCTPDNVVSISQRTISSYIRTMLGGSSGYHCCRAEKHEAYKGRMGFYSELKAKCGQRYITNCRVLTLGIPGPLYSTCTFECYTENVFTTKLLKELMEIIKENGAWQQKGKFPTIKQWRAASYSAKVKTITLRLWVPGGKHHYYVA